MFTTYFLDALTQPFGIRNHHAWILVVFGVVSRIVGASSVLGLDLDIRYSGDTKGRWQSQYISKQEACPY